MLNVRFAEMQRSVAKSLSSSLAPRRHRARRRSGPVGRHQHARQRRRSRQRASTADPGRSSDTNGAVLFGFNAGGGRGRRAARGAGKPRRRPHPGRAEPDRAVGPGGAVPRRRRISGPGQPGRRPDHRRVQAVRRRAELHPAGGRTATIINLELEAAVSSIDPTNGVTFNNFTDRRLPAARDLDHGRDARRRELRDRRPAVRRLPRPERPGAVAGRRAGAGRAVPRRPNTSASRPSW